MNKYRKKETAIIEAIQYIDKNKTLIMNFLSKSNTEKDEIIKNYSFNENGNLIIHTLEGDMKCNKGDYIIKGVDGEFYPCKQEIFEKTYELVYKITITETLQRDIIVKADNYEDALYRVKEDYRNCNINLNKEDCFKIDIK